MCLLLWSETVEAPWCQCKARIIQSREYRTGGGSRREREVGSINVWEALDTGVTTTKQGTTAKLRGGGVASKGNGERCKGPQKCLEDYRLSTNRNNRNM